MPESTHTIGMEYSLPFLGRYLSQLLRLMTKPIVRASFPLIDEDSEQAVESMWWAIEQPAIENCSYYVEPGFIITAKARCEIMEAMIQYLTSESIEKGRFHIPVTRWPNPSEIHNCDGGMQIMWKRLIAVIDIIRMMYEGEEEDDDTIIAMWWNNKEQSKSNWTMRVVGIPTCSLPLYRDCYASS